MRIEVHYIAQVRHAAGQAGETLQAESPCTVADLIGRLAQRHPPLRGLLLDEGGGVQASLLLFVGGRQVDSVAQPLGDGDVLMVLSPMAGG
jgi:MoaD family protein